jgi:hypothetical protein
MDGRARPWLRWIDNFRRDTRREPPTGSSVRETPDVREAIRALPTELDTSSLPNGVVELVVDDFDTPTRQLFDIHDGSVTLVQPGTSVPWASISGSPTAWIAALAAEGNTAELRLTGDELLAELVLAALPRRT